jgi:hypothetical protein
MHNTTVKLMAALLVTIGVASTWAFHSQSKRTKKINERWATSNRTFSVRVTAYAEDNGGFVAGAYYVFESAAVGSSDWREIMEFRHDDPVPIPRNQVRFVTDQIGYLFMVYKYAVTTDGGRTWSVWYISRDLPRWRERRAAIKEVRVESNGAGIMELQPFEGWQTQTPKLYTKDYGRHWSE